MTYIALSDYIGTAEPLKPAAIAFVAKPSTGCRSCIFNGQRSVVCRAAGHEAALRGIPDCEDNVIYVLKRTDERQLTLQEAV